MAACCQAASASWRPLKNHYCHQHFLWWAPRLLYGRLSLCGYAFQLLNNPILLLTGHCGSYQIEGSSSNGRGFDGWAHFLLTPRAWRHVPLLLLSPFLAALENGCATLFFDLVDCLDGPIW